MENLNVKKLGMNGMLINLEDFKVDKQDTIKKWINRDNYSQFKMDLEQYEDVNITIFLHGAKLGYEMNKDDVSVMIDCLMRDDVNVFCQQDEDGYYKFYLENRLIYTIDLDII